jgi:hypothetical protein
MVKLTAGRKRLASFVVLIALVAAVTPPAAAAAAPPKLSAGSVSVTVEMVPLGPDYVAGSAVASYPTYDVSLWAKVYKCTYAGWAHVLVNYQCRLKDPFSGYYLAGFTGSFSNGYANPSARTFRTANVYLCTLATAGYNAMPRSLS